MKRHFSGFYSKNINNEILKVFTDSLIIVDTNVLLSLYRYTKDNSDKLFKSLEIVSKNIWIPHQVALEYQNNRIPVIYSKKMAYDKLRNDMIKTRDNIKNGLISYGKATCINVNEWIALTESNFNQIITGINDHIQSLPTQSIKEDKTWDNVTKLFDGKVGEPYNIESYFKISKAGEVRFSCNIPPGFEDDGKLGIKKYGDLIIWQQIIDKAKTEKAKKPIIFITSDLKKDWCIEVNDKIYARPELVNEMLFEAGVPFYLITVSNFIEYVEKIYVLPEMKEAIEEAKQIEKSNKEYQDYISTKTTTISPGILSFTSIAEQLVKQNEEMRSAILSPGILSFTSIAEQLVKQNEEMRSACTALGMTPVKKLDARETKVVDAFGVVVDDKTSNPKTNIITNEGNDKDKTDGSKKA